MPASQLNGKKETVKEDMPTGLYSYVAPVGGLRASMTIQSSGAVKMDTLMPGTGEQDSISYTIQKGMTDLKWIK